MDFTTLRTKRKFLDSPSDLERVNDEVVAFIETIVDDAGADGVVVNLSGGIDSTLTAVLAVDALGAERVYGLLLPCNLSTEAGTHDAQTVADGLGIEYSQVHLQPLLNAFIDRVTPQFEPHDENVALGNVIARLRMVCAYFVANTTDRLVLGTGNRTELLLGYFTKYGDGGVDCLPIGDLYKTEVRSLARHVDLPQFVVEKPSTAGLWAGQTDINELGATYETVDRVLRQFVDHGEPVDEIYTRLDVGSEVVDHLVERYEKSQHKRTVPPTPSL